MKKSYEKPQVSNNSLSVTRPVFVASPAASAMLDIDDLAVEDESYYWN